MNGNLIVCPNTNQTSATSAAQTPAILHVFLLCISQSRIAERQMTAVKISFFLNQAGKGLLTLSVRKVRRDLPSFDSVLKPTRFRIGRGEGPDEERIISICDLVQSGREFNRLCAISERLIGTRRQQPGKIV